MPFGKLRALDANNRHAKNKHLEDVEWPATSKLLQGARRVEMGGVEPPSASLILKASTMCSSSLNFASNTPSNEILTH